MFIKLPIKMNLRAQCLKYPQYRFESCIFGIVFNF